jgi:ERCC4-type nuclease
MIFYDSTEITSTNLHERNFANFTPLPGMESFTGADYLIIPNSDNYGINNSTSTEGVLSFCESHKDLCILVQRKTNSDFYSSIAKLPFIAMAMLDYSNHNILFATGKLGLLTKESAWLACQSASLSWQLYYNGLYMHADTMDEFFQVLRQLDNRDLSKNKEIFARQPREKFKLVGKPWAYILASLPRIGIERAKELSEKYNSYPEALAAILAGQTTLGKKTVETIKRELGL